MSDFWYDASTGDLAQHLVSTVNEIDKRDSARRTRNLKNLRLYSSRALAGLGATEYTVTDSTKDNRLALNVVKACCDTAQAIISTSRPRAQYLTSGGNWEKQRKAKNLTKFTDGQFYQGKVYKQSPLVFLDTLITGTGVFKVFDIDARIKAERVFSDELLVDPVDARYGNPRSLYQTKEVDRAILRARYPKKSVIIDDSSQIRDTYYGAVPIADPVGVVEAWHLPAGDKDPGRHVICTSEGTLVDEDWLDPTFPFAFYRWSDPVIGFWGGSLVEELRGIQIEINYLLQRIQKNLTLSSIKIFTEKAAQINKAKLGRNVDYDIIEYMGKPPIVQVIEAVSPAMANQIENLYIKAFEITGISQLNATSRKPSGLDSGRAMREYSDITSQRFQRKSIAWQDYHLDIAEQMIRRARDIESRGEGSYSVKVKAGNALEELRFSDVNLDETDYIMQVFPVSFLPKTPEGKLQTVQELVQAFPQMQDQALELLDFPDLESATNTFTAPKKIMEKVVYYILEHDEYIGPEPFFDLAFGVKYMTMRYLQAKIDRAPEDKLELMRRWIDQAAQLIEASQPQPQGPPGPEAGLPAEAGIPNEQPMGPEQAMMMAQEMGM